MGSTLVGTNEMLERSQRVSWNVREVEYVWTGSCSCHYRSLGSGGGQGGVAGEADVSIVCVFLSVA